MKVLEVTPMLATENLAQTIEFYTEKLGFECRGLYPDAQNPCWASLWKDDAEIAFSLTNGDSKIPKPTLTGSIYFYVDAGIEELWEALKEKVTIEYQIEDMNYGMREFGIRDSNGYLLNFGQNIEKN